MLIVEDNTGLENADSYISVDDAFEYFDKFGGGNTFVESESNQEQALRNGTRIVDSLIRWIGKKLKEDQALEWPRTKEDEFGNLVLMEVPKEVKEAVCDLAELWLNDEIRMEPKIYERYGDTAVRYAYAYVEDKFIDVKRRLLKYGAFKSTVVTTYRA
jgi:hypothetical protein